MDKSEARYAAAAATVERRHADALPRRQAAGLQSVKTGQVIRRLGGKAADGAGGSQFECPFCVGQPVGSCCISHGRRRPAGSQRGGADMKDHVASAGWSRRQMTAAPGPAVRCSRSM